MNPPTSANWRETGALKVIVTIWDTTVCPRFDQCTEALVALIEDGRVTETRTVLLAHGSAEDLCKLIISEQAQCVVTGGIQRRYFEYLTWKKVEVIDSVMGPWETALERLCDDRLRSGDVLYERPGDERQEGATP